MSRSKACRAGYRRSWAAGCGVKCMSRSERATAAARFPPALSPEGKEQSDFSIFLRIDTSGPQPV